MPDYHNLYVETVEIPRTAFSDLPHGHKVLCSRSAGWELWKFWGSGRDDAWLVGGEFPGKRQSGLRLDVNGVIIVDSLPTQSSSDDADPDRPTG